jgi:hypothetical protein
MLFPSSDGIRFISHDGENHYTLKYFVDPPSDLLVKDHARCGNCLFFRYPSCTRKVNALIEPYVEERGWCADHKRGTWQAPHGNRK